MTDAIAPERLAALRAWCAQRGIVVAALFGSRATGRASEQSDYDLALTPAPPPAERLDWQAELEAILDRDVDLVFLSPETDPVLGWEIARNGRLLYEARPGDWAAWRARLWHAYNDALPFRRALEESLRRYAEEVRRVT
ncbi:MAG: nucleotidyltransferase domain-containing protein [Oscillochloridaceae bacterium]|nr:nucleotidyltransferase domain-containing protein [Chloroflexaceae bacterium]MDW8391089.1 nucleotidyltransferase domain-containing protein [Oscillochloridaceae bacterium]